MSKIAVLKLVSGEEIFGTVVGEDNPYTIELDSVRRLHAHQTAPGQMGLALIPWMMSAPDVKVKLYKSAIAAVVDETNLPKQLIDAYLQETSSIQIAGAIPGVR